MAILRQVDMDLGKGLKVSEVCSGDGHQRPDLLPLPSSSQRGGGKAYGGRHVDALQVVLAG